MEEPALDDDDDDDDESDESDSTTDSDSDSDSPHPVTVTEKDPRAQQPRIKAAPRRYPTNSPSPPVALPSFLLATPQVDSERRMKFRRVYMEKMVDAFTADLDALRAVSRSRGFPLGFRAAWAEGRWTRVWGPRICRVW